MNDELTKPVTEGKVKPALFILNLKKKTQNQMV